MHIDSTRWGFEGNSARRIRRAPGNDGPLEIDIVSDSLTEKFTRGKDTQNVAEFNAKIRGWGDSVRADLKSSISSLIAHDTKLSNSLKNTYYSEKKRNNNNDIEIDRIGFSFAVEGVYVHLGVGRGYVRSGGYTIRSAKNRSDHMRRPNEWFNPVIKNHVEELAGIVKSYYSELIINYSRIFIQS